ncbi:hypothetical protein EDD18DRAFT_1084586, partial [Armillaria luteobubalina]
MLGDFRAFAPKLPFEEAGPTSSIWYTYLGKIQDLETDLVAEQRGELNIILVFSGLFSAVITAFYMKSLENLVPDYQQVAVLLLLDQINIQCTLANGTSLDNIITSNADPTGDSFVPDWTDYGIYCLWVICLTLSLLIAFSAILINEWYFRYLSPMAGKHKVHDFHYKVRIHWHVRIWITMLQFLLNLSLLIF